MPITACRRFFDRFPVRDGRLLVAVSGGIDSVVLLDVVAELAHDQGLEIIVGHVNHQLRGEASDLDEAAVREEAARRKLPFRSARVDPRSALRDGPSAQRETLEEAARNLRRDALDAMARDEGAQWIAMAHHAGDQAETVLMRILRGTGPEGLAGIAEQSPDGRWIRPLLAVDPDRLREYASDRGLRWREDASNQDRAHARNRLRHDWLPALSTEFNPQLLRTLGNLAEAQRRDLEWIETLVDASAEEWLSPRPEGVGLSLEGWEGLPDALARRLIRRALNGIGLGRRLSRVHLERVLEFLRRGRAVGRDRQLELPEGWELRRESDAFSISRSKPRGRDRAT